MARSSCFGAGAGAGAGAFFGLDRLGAGAGAGSPGCLKYELPTGVLYTPFGA